MTSEVICSACSVSQFASSQGVRILLWIVLRKVVLVIVGIGLNGVIFDLRCNLGAVVLLASLMVVGFSFFSTDWSLFSLVLLLFWVACSCLLLGFCLIRSSCFSGFS